MLLSNRLEIVCTYSLEPSVCLPSVRNTYAVWYPVCVCVCVCVCVSVYLWARVDMYECGPVFARARIMRMCMTTLGERSMALTHAHTDSTSHIHTRNIHTCSVSHTQISHDYTRIQICTLSIKITHCTVLLLSLATNQNHSWS